MWIIAALAGGLALLYWWLCGNWFARVVVFLALCVVAFVMVGALYAGPSVLDALIYIGLGFFASWIISGLPTYRHKSA